MNGVNMEIYTTSQARENLFALINYTGSSHEPVYIVGKKHKAVLIAEDDYSAMMETIYLNSVPGMKDSIISSSQEPLKNFTDTLDWDDK